jgi:hypothetical protein
VCGPQLTARVVQSIEQANPSADPAVKYLPVQKALELMGCLAPPPPQQTTTCIPLGGGAFTCTTR